MEKLGGGNLYFSQYFLKMSIFGHNWKTIFPFDQTYSFCEKMQIFFKKNAMIFPGAGLPKLIIASVSEKCP